MMYMLLYVVILTLVNVNSYSVSRGSSVTSSSSIKINNYNSIIYKTSTYLLASSTEPIVSPFDSSSSSTTTTTPVVEDELELTVENVEKVLDEMRPYLQSDGGNVRLAEIDGPIVRLELQGACGSCPSS